MGVLGFCFDPNAVVLCGKRKFKSLFWRVRAEVKRQTKRRSKQKKFSFQYDPLSYALNFDNGNFGFFC
ncbi:hypothetical protein WN944_019838 [Citrus x changshan-huyou]|uniref:Uncharacterized protein n=3 Tax=Citrus TaxID=2706 RepID=A0A067FRC5_CITSI|nr:hypothetical protein KPL70_012554 [Citrus sinensis]KDO69949.1 hypothetical protein CISIN_1g035324mg [Citrus sinensis]GAY46976.1 hypothetical protein CUMW_101060 [Citrus unshiu]